jgi:NTE family protein
MARLAVAFGGGGIVGLGWELGIVEGLREAGVDLSRADTSIGTSAGAIVGAVLETGVPIASLPERAAELAQELESLTGSIDRARIEEIGSRWRAAGMRPSEPERAAIAALGDASPTGSPDAFVSVMARLLPVSEWPTGLVVTAVRATDGAFAAWGRDARVPLAAAVAASCALPGVFPPVPVDGARYVDGGLRSPTNLDLATGHDVVVAVVPAAGPDLEALLSDEAGAIRSGGGRLVEVLPDAAGVDAIGPDLFDVGRLLPAAMAGYEQGRSMASILAAVG